MTSTYTQALNDYGNKVTERRVQRLKGGFEGRLCEVSHLIFCQAFFYVEVYTWENIGLFSACKFSH